MVIDNDTRVGKRPMRKSAGTPKPTPLQRRELREKAKEKRRKVRQDIGDILVAIIVGWCFLLGAGVTYYYAVLWIAETLDLHFWDITITGIVMIFVLVLGAVTKKYRSKID